MLVNFLAFFIGFFLGFMIIALLRAGSESDKEAKIMILKSVWSKYKNYTASKSDVDKIINDL